MTPVRTYCRRCHAPEYPELMVAGECAGCRHEEHDADAALLARWSGPAPETEPGRCLCGKPTSGDLCPSCEDRDTRQFEKYEDRRPPAFDHNKGNPDA